MCSTLGSVKKNQNHIFQKLHTKKDLKKSVFANTLSRNLFEWIQNLIQNCVEIILSAHTSLKKNIFDSFLSLLEKMFWILGCFFMVISRTQVLCPSIKAWFINLKGILLLKCLMDFIIQMWR